MTKGYKHLTADQKARLVETYRKELTVTRTAEALGCTADQVRRHLRRHGIEPNGARPTDPCYQHADSLRQWASEGLSLSEMARRIGSKHQSIAKFLKRHEIPYTPWDRSKPENNPWWRGGRVIDPDGYVLVKQNSHPRADRHGYVREHRLVMERVLGRYLEPTEIVHHIDGDRANNDPENLEVFGSNQEHLAQTLAGKRPKWTDDGLAKMRAPRRRRTTAQRESIPEA